MSERIEQALGSSMATTKVQTFAPEARVKVNYLRFGPALRMIPGLEAAEA
jgi:hypothetical protein